LFVLNRLPTVPNYSVSPFEKLFHHVLEYQHLHTLECECFSLLRSYNQHKLQPRSESCVFMDYSALHKGYKCPHLPTQRLYVSRHVKFNKKYFFLPILPLSPPHQLSLHVQPLLPFYHYILQQHNNLSLLLLCLIVLLIIIYHLLYKHLYQFIL
jgi:hypothetical protein